VSVGRSLRRAEKGDSMELVWITALGVGGATVLGAFLGLIFKKLSIKIMMYNYC
jgi:hypothetical protein